MNNYTENKIKEALELAELLGCKFKSDIERSCFIESLTRIASSAVDEARREITNSLGDMSYKLTQFKP